MSDTDTHARRPLSTLGLADKLLLACASSALLALSSWHFSKTVAHGERLARLEALLEARK